MADEAPKTLTVDEAVRAVSQWLRLKGEHANPPNYSVPTSCADADHSSLLRRLLRGDKVFPKPPPRRFSYPDYELSDGKTVRIAEMFAPHHPIEPGATNELVVDQNPYWERTSDPLIIRYKETGQCFRLNRPLDELLADRQKIKDAGNNAFGEPEMTLTLVPEITGG